jgi:hypothetical protein
MIARLTLQGNGRMGPGNAQNFRSQSLTERAKSVADRQRLQTASREHTPAGGKRAEDRGAPRKKGGTRRAAASYSKIAISIFGPAQRTMPSPLRQAQDRSPRVANRRW